MNKNGSVTSWLIEKSFRSFMLVTIAGGVVAMLGSLIDSVFVGNFFSTAHMAAFGYAMPVFIIISAVAGLFSEGGKIAASSYIGEGDIDGVRSSFTLVCLCALLISGLMTALCLVLPNRIAVLMGARGELVQLTGDYIRGIGCGVVPIIMMQVLASYIGLDNGEKLSFLGIIVMSAVNVIFDYLVVTVLPWGLFGIGFATTLSYLAALLVQSCYFARKERLLLFRKPVAIVGNLKTIAVTGMPSAINRGCSSICSICLNNILFAVAGEAAVSAFSVQSTIYSFILTVLMGETSALCVFSSMFHGENNRTSLRFTFLTGTKYALILSGGLGVVLFACAPAVADILLDADTVVLNLASASLRWLAVGMPFTSLSMTFMYYYLSTEKYSLSYSICILRNGLRIAVAWFLSRKFATDGVWASVLFAELLLVPVLLVMLRRYRGNGFVSACMALPKDSGHDNRHVFEKSVPNTWEALGLAIAELKEFCTEAGVSWKQAMRIYLSVEEMVGNVIEHAYRGKNNCFVDIRLVIQDKQLALSIRDNGRHFNPLSYQYKDEQYGIRLIRGLCRNMQYHYIAGVNHLTINN